MKKKSICQRLHDTVGGDWRALRDGFGWRYRSADGREVHRYATPVLDYDGYSDTDFNIVYIDNSGHTVLFGDLFRLR